MRKLRAFCFRILGLFRRQRHEQDLADELESHLQLHIDDNLRAGMTPAQAQREALLRLGGVEFVKQAHRDRRALPWVAELWQDLRYAARILRKDKGFATVAILTLAFGIGANTAIFSLIDAILLKPLPVSHPEALLQVTMSSGATREGLSNPIWEQLRDRQDVFSGLFAFDSWPRFNLSPGGEARYANGIWASGDIFSTLGVRPALGRLLNRSDDRRGCPGVVVLSYSFWQKEYNGKPAVLDQTISLDFHRFPIVGVSEPGFFGVDIGRSAEVFLPLCAEPITSGENSYLDNPHSWPLRAIGRLKPGIGVRQVSARLRQLTPGIFDAALPAGQRKVATPLDVQPAGNGLSPARGRTPGFREEYGSPLIALMAAVSLVLLIACTNVANLLLARATVRQRELAVRLALGSGRARLIRQLLTESLLLSSAGAAMGVLFAQLAGRLLLRLLSSGKTPVFLDLAIDRRILLFTIVVSVVTGLFFGVAPAWRAAQIRPYAAMKMGGRGIVEGPSRFGVGKAFVIAQIALSLVLTVGAGLLMGTLRTLVDLDPGFQRERILLMSVDLSNGHYPAERRPEIFREILDRLRAVSGVRSASYSGFTPITPFFSGDMIVADGTMAKPAGILFNTIGDGYFKTVATPILAGRDFGGQDKPGSPKVAIVNQAMARYFYGGMNPVGRHYRLQQNAEGTQFGDPVEIVGLVRDSKFNSLREDVEPMIYVPMSQDKDPGLFLNFIMLGEQSPAKLIPGVKLAMARVNPVAALDFATLSQQVEESLTRERLLATLSGYFGGLALLLAAIGIYGVISYNVMRRRNEIGIRVALGAGQAAIQRLVLGEVAALAVVGLALGTGGALAATRLIASMLYGVKPADPVTMALSVALLMAVAALAGGIPAHRASRLHPMTALREE